MKNLILLTLGFILCANIQAQITIEHSDFMLDPNGDNIILAEYDPFNLAIPMAGADMTWDYTHGIKLGTNTFQFEATNNPNYPNANMRYSTTLSQAGMFFPSSTYGYVSVNQNGFGYEGIDVPENTVPLEFVTGNPADTLFHLGVPRTETNPWTFISFPLNYADDITTTSKSIQPVIVEAPTYGLSYFAINQELNTTVQKEVIGWGNLIVQNPSTSQDVVLEVLLQKRTEIRIDSFFDASQNPVPNALLNQLGLFQGATSSIIVYDFFAKGANYRVMRLVEDATGFAYYADINLEAFFLGFNVDTEEVEPAFVTHKVYPNPIQNNQFQLDLEKNNFENWQLEVYNLVGQTVHQETITENNSRIYLDTNLSTGHYLYTVKNEQGQVVAKGKLAL